MSELKQVSSAILKVDLPIRAFVHAFEEGLPFRAFIDAFKESFPVEAFAHAFEEAFPVRVFADAVKEGRTWFFLVFCISVCSALVVGGLGLVALLFDYTLLDKVFFAIAFLLMFLLTIVTLLFFRKTVETIARIDQSVRTLRARPWSSVSAGRDSAVPDRAQRRSAGRVASKR